MSEQNAVQANAAVQAAKQFTDVAQPEPHDPIFIHTRWGAVAVFGYELVSKKDLLIMGAALNMPTFELMDHGVRCVVLRKDGLVRHEKEAKFGLADPNTGAFAINLMKIFSSAVTECMDDEHMRFSIQALWHHNLIETFLHETHHIHVVGWDLEARLKLEKDDDGSFREKLENDADGFAETEMLRMAKMFDIEPEHPSKSPFFGSQLMELLANDDSDFAKDQRRKLENHILFEREAKGNEAAICLHSFKEYCSGIEGVEDEVVADEWAKTSIPLPDGIKTFAEAQVEEPTAVEPQPTLSAEEVTTTLAPEPPQMCATDDEEVVEEYFYDDEPTSWDDAAECSMPFIPGAPQATAATTASQPVTMQPPQSQPAQMTPPATGQPTQMAPPAGGGGGQVPVQQTAFPDHGIGPDKTRELVYGVFNKIYEHVFTHCGRAWAYPEEVQVAPDGGQCCVHNVWGMPIELTPEERAVVVAVDCLNHEGQYKSYLSTENGMLRGQIAKQAKIPMYKLHINFCGDHLIRLVMPQNPNKLGPSGQPSKPAALAQQGQRIMYVIDGVDKKDGQGSNFLFKCVEGAWQAC